MPATTREEQETLICFTEADDEAVVYTFRKKLWPLCEKAGGRLVHSGVRDGKEESREYRVLFQNMPKILNHLSSALKEEGLKREAQKKEPANAE